MTKKILVTGSAGFVASHFVEHILKNTDWDVIGLDSFRHRGDSLRIQPDMTPSRYKVFAHDLTTPISHRLREKIGPIHYIVNFAAESHVDRSLADPVPFVENNVKLMLHILQYAREVQPKKFIQISTDEVYGPAPEGTSHVEWSSILPSNPYAASKAAQESIAISYWRSYGVPLIITNCMNLFGARQDPEKFIPMLISKISKGEVVTIHGTQQYIGKRMYIHCRNFADGLLFLLQEAHPATYLDSGSDYVATPSRFNIVGEVEKDNLEVARFVEGVLGHVLKYELVDFHSARPGHDRRYALDGSKMKRMGWKQPLSFEQSLKETIEWTLAHPEWLK